MAAFYGYKGLVRSATTTNQPTASIASIRMGGDMEASPSLGQETMLVHAGEQKKILHSVVPPIFQVSTFVFEEYEQLMTSMRENPLGPPSHYSRISNPTLDVVEQKLA